MNRPPPKSTRADTLFPTATLCRSVAQGAEDTSTGAAHPVTAAQDLAAMADELRRLVGQFNVEVASEDFGFVPEAPVAGTDPVEPQPVVAPAFAEAATRRNGHPVGV